MSKENEIYYSRKVCVVICEKAFIRSARPVVVALGNELFNVNHRSADPPTHTHR